MEGASALLQKLSDASLTGGFPDENSVDSLFASLKSPEKKRSSKMRTSSGGKSVILMAGV
jgi:hypothetical protein